MPNSNSSSSALAPVEVPPLPLAHSTSNASAHRWLTLAVLASVNLCLGITLSCIVPFFPAQAKAKGLDTAQIGLIIGFYQLAGALSAPLIGRSMGQIGPNRLFSSGLCLAALAVISFGWLPRLPSASTFFFSALALRSLMALGLAAYKCSQTTILAQKFPQNLATIGGLLDTFSALSYSLGPLIGSVLTQLGGFTLPFAAFGLLMFGAGLASIWLLSLGQSPSAEEGQQQFPHSTRSNNDGQRLESAADDADDYMRAVLSVPQIWLTILGLACLMICCFFYDASLAEHIGHVDASPMLVGSLISITAFANMIGAPVCGFLVDRNPRALAESIMLAGAVGGVLFALTIGPSPLIAFFRLNIPILFAAFAIQGISLTAMCTPSFRDRGLNTDSAGICGCISGLIQGSISFGAFFGNTFGGFSAQKIGFEWTATLAAAFQIPFILGLICFKARELVPWPFGQKELGPMFEEQRQSTEERILNPNLISAI